MKIKWLNVTAKIELVLRNHLKVTHLPNGVTYPSPSWDIPVLSIITAGNSMVCVGSQKLSRNRFPEDIVRVANLNALLAIGMIVVSRES